MKWNKEKKQIKDIPRDDDRDNCDKALLSRIQPQGGISFKGDRYIITGSGYETCIHIYEFPNRVSDQWFAYVSNTKDTVAVIDLSTEDVLQVKRNLNKSMKEQNFRFQQANDYEERYDAQQRYNEMESLFKSIDALGEVIKILQIRIYVADRSFEMLEKRTKQLMLTLESNGFKPTIFLNEMRSEWDAMLATYTEQQKQPFATYGQALQSMAVAVGNSFHFSSLEDRNGDYLGNTSCGGNVIFDEFTKTASRKSYNSLVVGNSGSGKSTLLKKRFLQRAIRGDFVRTFDISGEYITLTRVLGGRVLKLDGSSGILNPLEILRSGETEGLSYMRHISKMSAIYRFLAGQKEVETAELLEFENLLRELYESTGLAPKLDKGVESQVTGLPATSYPTFSDFLHFVKEKIRTIQGKKYKTMEQTLVQEHLRQYDRIRRVLENTVINYGEFFDGHTTIDNISDQQIVTFDMSVIKDMKAEIFDAQLFNMVSFCWDNCVANGKIMKYRYEKENLPFEDVVRFLIIIDESHRWINAERPFVLEQIGIYLRESRKFFGGIMLASQSIRDYVPEGTGAENFNKIKTIFELTQYKFLFQQDTNVMPLIEQIFSGILTESQMDRIPKLQQGENILCIAGDKNYEFKVRVRDDELDIFEGGA